MGDFTGETKLSQLSEIIICIFSDKKVKCEVVSLSALLKKPRPETWVRKCFLNYCLFGSQCGLGQAMEKCLLLNTVSCTHIDHHTVLEALLAGTVFEYFKYNSITVCSWLNTDWALKINWIFSLKLEFTILSLLQI